MVINPNPAGVATANNNLSSNSSSAAKAARQTTIPADDVTLSSRTPAHSAEILEINDAEGAWKASDFARNYILANSHSALLVQGNVNPQSVLDLLAE